MDIPRTDHSRYVEWTEDCREEVGALYFLDGSSPSFRPLIIFSSSEREKPFDCPPEELESDPWVHLRHFLDLRARMRAAFPLLSHISDDALLAILGEVSGGYHGGIALVRLMPGHPDRGDGQPQTEAERKAMVWGEKVPKIVDIDDEPAPPIYLHDIYLTTMRGMAVPVYEYDILKAGGHGAHRRLPPRRVGWSIDRGSSNGGSSSSSSSSNSSSV